MLVKHRKRNEKKLFPSFQKGNKITETTFLLRIMETTNQKNLEGLMVPMIKTTMIVKTQNHLSSKFYSVGFLKQVKRQRKFLQLLSLTKGMDERRVRYA